MTDTEKAMIISKLDEFEKFLEAQGVHYYLRVHLPNGRKATCRQKNSAAEKIADVCIQILDLEAATGKGLIKILTDVAKITQEYKET